MKIIIVAAGNAPGKELVFKELNKNSLIMAADGGGNYLYRYGICPDYLIGDMDSINPNVLEHFVKKGVSIIEYPVEKDYTDGQLSVYKALTLKPKEIVILGALGGVRVDHFLGALGWLECCLENGVNGLLEDEYQLVRLFDRSTTISGEKGMKFSLQAYGGTVRNLSIRGSKYILDNYLLRIGDSRTIANEFKTHLVEISFESGKLLVITY